MKITSYKTAEVNTIEDIERVVTNHFEDKYTYKLTKKASTAGQLIGKSQVDSFTVIKNAYHRSVVVVDFNSKDNSTSIRFEDYTLAGWLGFLNNQVGFIGSLIIRLIYGSGGDFYSDVENSIKTNIDGEDITLDVGLGALFKKKDK